MLNWALISLLVVFVFLSALDVLTTNTAMNVLPSFYEFNQLAASLFHNRLDGLLSAVVLLKATPVAVIVFAILLKEKPNTEKHSHPYQIRVVKLGVLIGLLLFNIFYGYVVLFNNLALLIHYA